MSAWEKIQTRPVREIEAEVFEQMTGRSDSDPRSPWADLALALCERVARAEAGLRAVEAHHRGMNGAAGRPLTNSTTLRIVTAALAGCDHLAGDVCHRCYPSLPVCARHPEATIRRFGPLWRCGECGEDADLLPDASPPLLAPRGDADVMSDDRNKWGERPKPITLESVMAVYERELGLADDLADAAAEVLVLPPATVALRHLDHGIGTATPDAAWLRLRSTLNAMTAARGSRSRRSRSGGAR